MIIGVYKKDTGKTKYDKDLNNILKNIEPKVTIIFNAPMCYAAVYMKEFHPNNRMVNLEAFVDINPNELKVIKISSELYGRDPEPIETCTRYKPFLKDSDFKFISYDSEDEAEAACARIKTAINCLKMGSMIFKSYEAEKVRAFGEETEDEKKEIKNLLSKLVINILHDNSKKKDKQEEEKL